MGNALFLSVNCIFFCGDITKILHVLIQPFLTTVDNPVYTNCHILTIFSGGPCNNTLDKSFKTQPGMYPQKQTNYSPTITFVKYLLQF